MDNSKQNIAIIGAGIMGLSAAYALSEKNHTITLYDPLGFPAHNASWMAGGMLAPWSEIEHIPVTWVNAGLEGINHWKATFPDLLEQNGSLLIAHEEDRYILERFKAHLPPEKQKLEPINDLEPMIADHFKNGLHLREEAHLNPHSILNALHNALKSKSCTFIKQSTEPKDISAQYDHIIDCRGYTAEKDDPDLRGLKGELAIVQNKEFSLSRPVRLMHPRYPLYIVPREGHIFMIGATIIESAENDHVSVRSALELLSALYSLSPSFGEANILEITAGIRPAYNDNLPRIRRNNNIIAANGLFRHGFLLAPVMANCITDMIKNKTNEFTPLFTGEPHNETHDQRHNKKRQSAA